MAENIVASNSITKRLAGTSLAATILYWNPGVNGNDYCVWTLAYIDSKLFYFS